MWPEESHAPYFEYHPPWRNLESVVDKEASVDFDLGAPLELGPEVNCFLQGPATSSEERIGGCPPQNPHWKSWRIGGFGDPGCRTCLAGGRNWLRFQGYMSRRNWHGRCGPLSNYPDGLANGARLRTTTKPHQYHHAFVVRVSCHCLIPNSPAGTSENCSGRRRWPMPKPSSFGQKKPVSLLRANYAFWWGA